jgi:hypothetical protein
MYRLPALEIHERPLGVHSLEIGDNMQYLAIHYSSRASIKIRISRKIDCGGRKEFHPRFENKYEVQVDTKKKSLIIA